MKVSLGIMAVAGLAMVAGDASAQDRAQRLRERDRNGDGVLSQEEYVSTGGHPGNFAALDVNHDGVLTHAEFVTRDAPGNAPMVTGQTVPSGVLVKDDARFGDLDRDRDGVLTKWEWNDDDAFRKVDRDGDGRVSAWEWEHPSEMTSTASADALFASYDRNRDGLLTRREWPSTRAEFSRYDRNNDGRVTAAEFASPLDRDTVRGQFALLDRNNDGRLSSSEWGRVSLPERFEVADRNRDGRVTLAEFRARPFVRQVAREWRDDRQDARRFDAIDRNNDGVVSRSEWTGDTWTFNSADWNRDGVLTVSEYDAVSRTAAPAQVDIEDFAHLDHDRDGYISRTEWHGDVDTFRRLDRNDDGRLTTGEYAYLNRR